ncbi:MAG: ABC transporter ATP-binding protein [Peptococcia bacterium]
MRTNAAIVVEDLWVKLGDKEIISGLNLHLARGNFFAIIGPNGAGKTTLLRAMAGDLMPTQGSVYLNGVSLRALKSKEKAQRIAYVAQNGSDDLEFNVLDYVLLGRYPYLTLLQNETTEDLAYAREAMELTNTWSLREKNINQISGGERQRVILARAISQNTPIILLDEPISQLDLYHQLELMDTLQEMVAQGGKTVVAVLHDLNMAAQYCDYLVLLNEGRIMGEGSPEEVIRPEIIADLYKLQLKITQNPETGRPYIIPTRGNNSKSSG